MLKKIIKQIQQIFLQPYSIVVIATLLFATIITGVLYERKLSLDNSVSVMRETAKTLAQTVAFTSEKSAISMQRIEKELIQNLLIKLRFLREIENSGKLTLEEALRYTSSTKLKIIKLGDKGKIKFASLGDESILTNNLIFLQTLQRAVLTSNISEIKINFPLSKTYRKLLIIKCSTGNNLVLIPPSNLFSYRYSVGLGSTMKMFSELPDIHYIVWKDDTGIISATKEYSEFSERKKQQEKIMEFEIPALLKIEEGQNGKFLVGMSTSRLQQINRSGIIRVGITFIIVITITVIFLKITAIKQRHELEIIQNERLISMGKLAAGVAHEVRNPLNAVGLSLQQLLSDKTLIETDKDNAMLLRTACEEIKRADLNLTHFLQYARPPKLNLRLTEIDKLIKKTTSVIFLQAEENNIKIEFKIEKDLQIDLDPDLMHQVLINISLNAIDSMETGGVLTFEAYKKHSSLEIKIKDTGSGIKLEDRDRVFELYYTTKQKGVGLGLPFVHQIISLHEGIIQIEDNVPKGTCVKIIL